MAAIGGGVAIIVKCIKSINTNHDRLQKYDGYEERINKLESKINDHERQSGEQLEKVKEELQLSIDSKLQQISSELCLLSYCVGATLDGLKQLNCNGEVTEAKKKMEKHLNQQAHGEK